MHNTINLRTQRTTYFIPSVDVFCYCHFLKDVKSVLTVKSCVLCDCFQHFVSLQQLLSCTVDWCCGLWIGLLYSYYLLTARENYTLDVSVVNSRRIKGNLQDHTILQKWKWFMVVTDSLPSSIATYDLNEKTARSRFIGQVDFSS